MKKRMIVGVGSVLALSACGWSGGAGNGQSVRANTTRDAPSSGSARDSSAANQSSDSPTARDEESDRASSSRGTADAEREIVGRWGVGGCGHGTIRFGEGGRAIGLGGRPATYTLRQAGADTLVDVDEGGSTSTARVSFGDDGRTMTIEVNGERHQLTRC